MFDVLVMFKIYYKATGCQMCLNFQISHHFKSWGYVHAKIQTDEYHTLRIKYSFALNSIMFEIYLDTICMKLSYLDPMLNMHV